MTSLVQYESACAALAVATTINQVLNIRDEVENLRYYAKKVKDRELVVKAATLQLMSERRLGELLIAAKASGQIKRGQPKKNCSEDEQYLRVKLDEAGIDRKLSSKAQKTASLSKRAFEAMVDQARTRIMSGSAMVINTSTADKKDRRNQRERDLADKIEKAAATLNTGKVYGVILADPPWRFEPYSRETGMDRAPENHYPTMTVEDIKALDVPAAADCVLFLWATAPMLPEALAVMQAWGFTYKSHAVWVKDKIGTGYWFRNQHELLLVGTKGNVPAPAMGTQDGSVFHAPVGKHSEKPPNAHLLIESHFPSLPKLEMFSRQSEYTPGWTIWGAEAPAGHIDLGNGEVANAETGEIEEVVTVEHEDAGELTMETPLERFSLRDRLGEIEPTPVNSRAFRNRIASEEGELSSPEPSSQPIPISPGLPSPAETGSTIVDRPNVAMVEPNTSTGPVSFRVRDGHPTRLETADAEGPVAAQAGILVPSNLLIPSHNSDPAPVSPAEGAVAASVSGQGTPAAPSIPSADPGEMPTFLKRGHPDCVVKS